MMVKEENNKQPEWMVTECKGTWGAFLRRLKHCLSKCIDDTDAELIKLIRCYAQDFPFYYVNLNSMKKTSIMIYIRGNASVLRATAYNTQHIHGDVMATALMGKGQGRGVQSREGRHVGGVGRWTKASFYSHLPEPAHEDTFWWDLQVPKHLSSWVSGLQMLTNRAWMRSPSGIRKDPVSTVQLACFWVSFFPSR